MCGADESALSLAIKSGGLHHIKAVRIWELAAYVLDEYSGDLSWVYTMPQDSVRIRLMEMPGIGPKTADVLLFRIHGHQDAIVVDTHMFRIANWLGLVERGASYDEVKRCLTSFFPWENIPVERRERT